MWDKPDQQRNVDQIAQDVCPYTHAPRHPMVLAKFYDETIIREVIHEKDKANYTQQQ